MAFTNYETEQLHKALLKETRHCAVTLGMKKTSVDQLTKAVGIAKGSFYKFYESKEMLFFAVLENIHSELYGVADRVLGEADSNCTTVADLLAQWQDTAIAPAAQYAVIHQLDNAVDAMYTAAKAKATDDALDQINSLDASYVSTQSILQREIAQNYTTAAQSYNTMASGFPANVIGTLWGAGQVELYAAQ